MENYFLNNKVPLTSDVNCFVITTEKKFNSMLGIAKSLTNTVHTPDFNKEIVLAVAIPPTQTQTDFKFEKATTAGDFIEVYFTEKKSNPLTYTMQPLGVVSVPRYPGVKNIRFYKNKVLVKKLVIK